MTIVESATLSTQSSTVEAYTKCETRKEKSLFHWLFIMTIVESTTLSSPP